MVDMGVFIMMVSLFSVFLFGLREVMPESQKGLITDGIFCLSIGVLALFSIFVLLFF